ncbi:hypothetical protein K438DRAFT_1974010 [Mycena galopus ATCC 62051]|nr:hypothetical protein K438DRAFT_1974010 [Mycena galopus ATCC 62051]
MFPLSDGCNRNIRRPRRLRARYPSPFLVAHVEVLHPTTAFDTPTPHLAASRAARPRRAIPPDSCSSPEDTITPACLQPLHGIPLTRATQTSNTLLVAGYAENWPQTAALELFLQNYRSDMQSNTTLALKSLDGRTDQQGEFFFSSVLEGNLDIQARHWSPVTFLTVGNDTTQTGFITSLLATTFFLTGAADPPSTMTTSYGDNEINFGSSLPTKICNGYMALGARGTSVLFSPGDGGVHGPRVPRCSHSMHQRHLYTGLPCVRRCPLSPPSAHPSISPLKTAESFSSGGFSDVFPLPAYQSASVAAYLAALPSDFPRIFNAGARGFPDVAFQGRVIIVVQVKRFCLDHG